MLLDNAGWWWGGICCSPGAGLDRQRPSAVMRESSRWPGLIRECCPECTFAYTWVSDDACVTYSERSFVLVLHS